MPCFIQREMEYFDYCNEREQIRKRRAAGWSFPWTDDSIIRDHYFCNVFREDDKHTTLIRKTFRKPGHPSPIAWLVFVRWLSYNALQHFANEWVGKPFPDYKSVLKTADEIPDGRVFHGAYMLKSATGTPKLLHAHRVSEQAESLMGNKIFVNIEEAWAAALHIELFGGFMAYELATDLNETAFVHNKEHLWCHFGPGAMRGLDAVYPELKRDPLHSGRRLLTLSKEGAWKHERPWRMREVEHNLCEFSKYDVVKNGGRAKRKYHPKGENQCRIQSTLI